MTINGMTIAAPMTVLLGIATSCQVPRIGPAIRGFAAGYRFSMQSFLPMPDFAETADRLRGGARPVRPGDLLGVDSNRARGHLRADFAVRAERLPQRADAAAAGGARRGGRTAAVAW